MNVDKIPNVFKKSDAEDPEIVEFKKYLISLTKKQLLSGARLPDEEYGLYIKRRKFINDYNKNYLTGIK